MLRKLSLLLPLALVPAFAQSLEIALPERTRLLEDQRIDLVLEVRNATGLNSFSVVANTTDITSRFTAPKQMDLDCDTTTDTVYRADLVSFAAQSNGYVHLVATVNTAQGQLRADRWIRVFPFTLPAQKRNFILYIGDAMGTAYRDAGRLVGRSVEVEPNYGMLREGFFDRLLEMDRLPVSGMVMTYASDRVIPDSANTATAWSSGNKTFEAALNVFADGTDCTWRVGGVVNATLPAVLDNPRVETLWEYLKRKYNYRTGVVTTAYVEDATPAGEGAHTAQRSARFEVARQYLENPMLNNSPVYDVIMGGGKDEFDPDIRLDGRNLVAEFQAKGYRFISSATELRNITGSDGKVLGLFRRSNSGVRHSSGIRSSVDANMDVAYDKLGLTRPGSEPLPDFGAWKDQPFLDLMTQKAITALSGTDGNQPFILMVEGASVDKQSHPNHAAGVIWDVLELDKAVGVGRAWAKARKTSDTLIAVTADHDQSMSIIGVNTVDDADYTDRGVSMTMNYSSATGSQTAKVYRDVHSNVRASYPYSGSGGDPNTSGTEGPPAWKLQQVYTEGFPNYSDADGDGYPENRAAGERGRRRLSVGFRTGNHTGSSVPITAEGPGAFLFTGYMDQTDIMFKAAVALTGDTAEGDAFVTNVLLNPKYPKTIGQ